MADESDLGAIYLARHGTQAELLAQSEAGAVERSAARQAGPPAAAPSALDQAAQTGVPIAPMTPGGAPNLPPMIPPGTRVPIVPPGFRGDEPAAAGRPRMAPAPQMRPNAGVGAKGLLETAAEHLPDIPGAYGPFSRQAVQALAQGLDYIGSVLNVPYEAGATALVGASQPYFDRLAEAGVPQAQIVQMQETLSQGYQIIGALVAPGGAGGLNLANPETALAAVQGVKKIVQLLSRSTGLPAVSTDLRLSETGAMRQLNETKVKAGDQPTRVYHGTPEAFPQLDLTRADKGALYGPGLYFTEDPGAAGLHAAGSKAGPAPAGNIRPAYLDIRHPFDIESRVRPAEVEAILSAAEQQTGLTGLGATGPLAEHRGVTTLGGSLYRDLSSIIGRDQANAALQAAGYDGITHMGGTGTANPNRVWIAFDPSQVVSPFEHAASLSAQKILDESGGIAMATVTTMARALTGMVVGSFVGDTQEKQARNALIGLGLGAVASPALIRRMVRGARDLAAAAPTLARDVTTAVESPHVTILPATDAERAAFLTATGDALPMADRLAQINWATIRDPESIDALTEAVTKARPVVKTVISQEETRVMATDLGLTTQQVLDTLEKQGGFSARIQAKKDLYVASRTKLGALAEQIDAMVPEAPGYAELDAAFRQQFGTSAALLQRFLDDASDAGRAMNILKAGAQDVGDTAGMAAMAGTDVSAIPTDTLVGQVKSLVGKGPEATTTYLQKITNAGSLTLQTLNWAYIHALLSTFEGASANTLSNLILLTESPMLRVGSAALGSVREVAGQLGGMQGELASRTYWGAPFAQVIGSITAIPEAFGAAADLLHAGAESRFGGIAKEVPRFRPSGDPATWTGSAINLVSALVELPSRLLLMAPDEFAKVLNYRGEVWAQAYNMVEKESAGLPFAPLRLDTARERFVDIVRNPERTMQQVATGKTESVGDIATTAANVRTLNEPLTGRLQGLTQALSHPIVRMTVAPFQKIPINLLRYNWEHIPVLGLAVERARNDWNAGGEAKDLLLAKWALGGGLITWGATKALTGEITGGGPLDPNQAELWRAEGFQKYAFRYGDAMISYNRFDTLGSLVGMAAEYTQLRPYMRQDEADALASAVVLTVADNLLSKTFMRSAAELMALIMAKRPQDLEKNKFLKSFIASYVPSGVAQTERYVDPTIRATYGLFDEIKARVPGYSSELPPLLNWLTGEPKLSPPGWSPDWLPGFVSILSPMKITTLKHDPVIREMLALQVSIPSPPPYLWGPNPDTLKPPDPKDGIPLSPEQHYYYIREAAKAEMPNKAPGEREKTSRNQYDAIKALMASDFYQKLTPTSRTDVIHSTVTAYRDHAQQLTLKKYPDLAQAYAQRFVEVGVDKMGEATRPKLQTSADKLIQRLTR